MVTAISFRKMTTRPPYDTGLTAMFAGQVLAINLIRQGDDGPYKIAQISLTR